MPIKRIGSSGKGTGGQHLPFARATQADGWLYVSGQVAMEDGEIIDGGIVKQSHKAIQNMLSILKEAEYDASNIMRIGVWLDDARDFASFNKVFSQYFTDHPPARACVQSSMVVDCKIEIDCIAYRPGT